MKIEISDEYDSVFVWPIKDGKHQGVRIYSISGKEVHPREIAKEIHDSIEKEMASWESDCQWK